jgi:uncharacterized coiled-coil protein SlyX
MNEYAPWVSALIAAAAIIISLVGNRSKAHQRRIENMEARVDKLEDRVLTVEGTMAHLPDKDTTHRTEVSIAQMKGEIALLAERLKPVSEIAGRLQEYMLETSGKK